MNGTMVADGLPVKHDSITFLGSLEWVWENASFVLGLLCLLFTVVTALFAPYLSSHDPGAQELRFRLLPPAWTAGGRSSYLLGADHLGRDILARIFYGGRVSLLVALATTVCSGMLGTLLGLIAGYVGGWAETIIMSLVDIQLSLPFMVLSLAVIAAVGPGLGNVVVLLIITQWVVFARVVRGLVLSLKEEDFVLAARALGATGLHIARRHVLPNCWGPILALAIPSVAGMIIAEAALSFLGLGVRPPTPTWGGMLSDARVYLHQAPWFAVLAGVPIVITVLGINLLGDWSRGHLDPRQRRKR